MNILFQAYVCDPNRGGEFAISWGWLKRLNSLLNESDYIYVVSDSLTDEMVSSNGLKHVKVLPVLYPKWLYQLLRHTRIWYLLWQRYAFRAAVKSGVAFDIIHVYSLSDFRRIGIWYKMKNSFTILGPVGGAELP